MDFPVFCLFPYRETQADEVKWHTADASTSVFSLFEPCKFKTSQNDEKWWDCFQSRIVTNSSASGKVEASQNMAEENQIGLNFIFRIWSVSNLDVRGISNKAESVSNIITLLEPSRHNCK